MYPVHVHACMHAHVCLFIHMHQMLYQIKFKQILNSSSKYGGTKRLMLLLSLPLSLSLLSPLRYPGYAVLTRLFVEHHQWTAYKKAVLQDTLKALPGFTAKEKKSKMKKGKKGKKISQATVPDIVLNLVDDDGDSYDKCLSNEVHT